MDKKYGIFVICTAILFLSFVGNASAKTWYVDDDGSGADFTKIQDAIDAASPGDTVFVWNGTYYEDGGVSISKERITLQGEDANTTIIPGKWTAEKVVYVTGNYVNVSGFTVTDSSKYGYGIYIVGDNCLISDNVIDSTGYGICLHSSSNCRIENNIANSNRYGIELSSSSNCNVTNNIVDSNDYGVCLGTTSTDNNITENNITNNNEYGMYLDWSGNNEIYHNIFIDNNKQAYDHHGFNNWDKGPTIGGNHWNDHICHGNPSNGTEPYTKIDTNIDSEDKYPFEDPDGWVMPPPPRIMSNAPESPLNDVEGAIRTFNITVNQTVNVSWQINGTVVQTNESVTEVTYTNQSASNGTWNVSAIVTNVNGSDMQTWDWIVTKVTPGAPEITSYSPETPVYDIERAKRTFNVAINQTVNVSWYLNDSLLFTNESVMDAYCTLHAEVAGEHNVSAFASNANGTDMQMWIWNVTAAPTCNISLTAGWNMISLPLEPANLSASSVLPTIPNAGGIAYLWNASKGQYDAIYDDIELELGRAYWIAIASDGTWSPIGTDAQGIEVNLAPGWNMIGVPSTTNVSAQDLTITVGANTYNLVDAANNGYIGGIFYPWNATTEKYDATVISDTAELKPGIGYFANVNQECSITYP